jgi:hypothetical protein
VHDSSIAPLRSYWQTWIPGIGAPPASAVTVPEMDPAIAAAGIAPAATQIARPMKSFAVRAVVNSPHLRLD